MSDINAPRPGDARFDSAQKGLNQPFLSQNRVSQNNRGEEDSAPLNIQFVLTALRRRWLVAFLGVLVLTPALVALVWMTIPAKYQATSLLQIRDTTPFIAFQSKEDSRRFLETQMELIRSPLVLGPVIEKPEIAQSSEIQQQTDPIAWLGLKIKAVLVGQSELVKVSLDLTDSANATRIVNAIAESYLDFRGREDSEQTQRIIQLLEEEKNRRLRDVEAMRQNIREFAKQTTGKDPFAHKSQQESQRSHPLADIEAKLVTAEVERQVLEARIKACQQSLEQDEGDVSDVQLDRAVEANPGIRTLNEKLTLQRARLRDYETMLAQGDKSPSYLTLSRDVAREEENLQAARQQLREGLHEEIAQGLKSERKDRLRQLNEALEGVRLTEKLLEERGERLRENAKDVAGDSLQLEFKEAELDRAEQVLSMIAERAIKLRTEQRAPARVVLLKKADEPTVANHPIKQAAAAGFAGFCLPLVLVVVWEWFSRRVSTSQQIEQARLRVIGEIARLPVRSVSKQSLSRRAGRELGIFEESIDNLRTRIELSESFCNSQVLAITSATASEGKTSLALQLTMSIARSSGRRVLLIDADMRSPDIHQLLQIRREPGLAEALSRHCSVQDAIVTDWSESIHVIPAGRLRTNPHKLLGGDAMKNLLDELRPLYANIVIDTPPILPASESLVLSRLADVCLVCAMRDTSRIDHVRRSCDWLADAGAATMGVVLNGVPVRKYARECDAYYGYVWDRTGKDASSSRA